MRNINTSSASGEILRESLRSRALQIAAGIGIASGVVTITDQAHASPAPASNSNDSRRSTANHGHLEKAPKAPQNPYFCKTTSECIDRLPYLLAEVSNISISWAKESGKGFSDDLETMPNGEAKDDLYGYHQGVVTQMADLGSERHFENQRTFNDYLEKNGCQEEALHETLVQTNCHYEKLIKTLYDQGMMIVEAAKKAGDVDPTAIENAERQLSTINPYSEDPDFGYKGREGVLVGNFAIFSNFPPKYWPVADDLTCIDKPNQDLVGEPIIIIPKDNQNPPFKGTVATQGKDGVTVRIDGTGMEIDLPYKDWGKGGKYDVAISKYPEGEGKADTENEEDSEFRWGLGVRGYFKLGLNVPGYEGATGNVGGLAVADLQPWEKAGFLIGAGGGGEVGESPEWGREIKKGGFSALIGSYFLPLGERRVGPVIEINGVHHVNGLGFEVNAGINVATEGRFRLRAVVGLGGYRFYPGVLPATVPNNLRVGPTFGLQTTF